MTSLTGLDSSGNFGYISENYKRITNNIGEAAVKYGVSEQIAVVAVTKTVPPEAVNAAIACGIRIIGENRVQEYLAKRGFYNINDGTEVHFIGSLQSNKVRKIIPDAGLIQSVDSISLAEEINRIAEKNGVMQNILIEVNAGGEETKGGVRTDRLGELAEKVSALKNLRFKGLMAIPPPYGSEACFAEMQAIFGDMKKSYGAEILSMGMSNDYEIALKYGANMVRVGRALFGERLV